MFYPEIVIVVIILVLRIIIQFTYDDNAALQLHSTNTDFINAIFK